MEVQRLLDQQEALFLKRTRRGQNLLSKASRYMPGGIASGFWSQYPLPVVLDHGQGPRVWDVDGNEYIDWHCGHGATLAGHNNPALNHAILQQSTQLVHSSSSHTGVGDYVEKLCLRFDMQRAVLCASGSEATMTAIRLARAYTSRESVLMTHGAYHGHHDAVMKSMRAGEFCTRSEGITCKSTFGVEFNDVDALRGAFQQHQPAAFIIEPVMLNLGLVLPHKNYLADARQLCDEYGVVFIWDEIKTAATIAYAGAQSLWPDVRPHVLCLGKVVGGGLPIGVCGGDAAILDLIPKRVEHWGTWAGHPLTCASGEAMLDLLTMGQHQMAVELQTSLCADLNALITQYSLPMHSQFLGRKGGVFATAKAVSSYAEWRETIDGFLHQSWWLYALNHGHLFPSGADEQWTLSLAITQQDCTELIKCFANWCEQVSSV